MPPLDKSLVLSDSSTVSISLLRSIALFSTYCVLLLDLEPYLQFYVSIYTFTLRSRPLSHTSLLSLHLETYSYNTNIAKPILYISLTRYIQNLRPYSSLLFIYIFVYHLLLLAHKDFPLNTPLLALVLYHTKHFLL
jgi:hypothetical protein